MAREFLFAYGTLRKGCAVNAYRILNRYCDYFAEGVLNGQLFEVDGYPGVVATGHVAETVVGELYVVNSKEKLLAALDEYEECTDNFPQPHEYMRQRLPIKLADGDVVQAWVYVYNRPTDALKRIDSGDYLKYHGSAFGSGEAEKSVESCSEEAIRNMF